MSEENYTETSEFKSFACEMLKLDKRKVTKENEEFYANHRLSEIEDFHSEEVKKEIQQIYRVAGRMINDQSKLCISIFNFCERTEAGYGQVAKVLESLFSTSYSKGYICRLYKAGELRSKFSFLDVVTDLEKLYLLSKFDSQMLSENLEATEGDVYFYGKPVNLSPRKEFREFIKGLSTAENVAGNVAVETPIVEVSEDTKSDSEDHQELSLETLRQSVERHLGLIGDDENLWALGQQFISAIEKKLSTCAFQEAQQQ